MLSLRTKSMGLLLGWAAVSMWFGATAFHHALHPHHAHGPAADSVETDAHDCHDHGHEHDDAPALPGDNGLHDAHHAHIEAHTCGLCLLASNSSLPAPESPYKARWFTGSDRAPVLPSFPAPSSSARPDAPRGPPARA